MVAARKPRKAGPARPPETARPSGPPTVRAPGRGLRAGRVIFTRSTAALAVAVIIGLALGNIDFSQLKVILKASADPTKEVAIRYGQFLNFVIALVIIALVVYAISIALLRLAPSAPEPPTRTCPFCKEIVPVDATICRACASAILAGGGGPRTHRRPLMRSLGG